METKIPALFEKSQVVVFPIFPCTLPNNEMC